MIPLAKPQRLDVDVNDWAILHHGRIGLLPHEQAHRLHDMTFFHNQVLVSLMPSALRAVSALSGAHKLAHLLAPSLVLKRPRSGTLDYQTRRTGSSWVQSERVRQGIRHPLPEARHSPRASTSTGNSVSGATTDRCSPRSPDAITLTVKFQKDQTSFKPSRRCAKLRERIAGR